MQIKKEKVGPGEESVWDYPRPPRLEPFSGHIRIVHKGKILADTHDAWRVLETSHPPTYYLPPSGINYELLEESEHHSFCEFKGMASYFDLRTKSGLISHVGWYYPSPSKNFKAIADHISFYASKVDACYVNDEKVQAQQGDFYGGWITSRIKGPFKGGPGTFGW